MMNKIRTIKRVEFSSRTLALLLMVVLVMAVSNASAKEHKPRGYDAESHVVAHLSFSGLSAVDMAMQRKVNDKYYLYVEHSKDQGISIIRYQQAHSTESGCSNRVARPRPV
jgi:hypothetical protein